MAATGAASAAFDWLLVFAHGESEDEIQERAHVIKSLKAAGLVPIQVLSRYHDALEVHIWLRCSADRLEQEAEARGLKKELTDNGGLVPFQEAKRHLFAGPIGQPDFFTGAERQQLIASIIEAPNSVNGAGLDLDKLRADGYLITSFPLHDPRAKAQLVSEWLETSLFTLDGHPVDLIRDYFGEEVALYFAWGGHFVKSFFPLAFLGVVTQIAQSIIKSQHLESGLGGGVSSSLNLITALYGFIMQIFIATYTFAWARRQYDLSHRWGVNDLKADYHALSRDSPAIDMAMLKRWESTLDSSMDAAEDFKRYIRWASVAAQLVLLSAILGIAAAFTVAMRVARDSLVPDPLSLETTVMFSIAEAGRSMAFQILGQQALAVLEPWDSAVFLVPAVQESWADAKRSLYDLVNNNLVLIYISLTTAFGDPRDFSWPARCFSNDCMMDLQVNVWALVISKVVLPIVFSFFWSQVAFFTHGPDQHAQSARKATDAKAVTKKEGKAGKAQGGGVGMSNASNKVSTGSLSDIERKLPKFSGVHVAYSQLCPLIGIVVVFGCSAPASMALLLVIVQLKLKYDSYLAIMTRQRPRVRRSKDTGSCFAYLVAITTMANVMIPTLMLFVFREISLELLGQPDCPVQYICYTDPMGDLRYNSTIPAFRWRVHPSDSNKHWLLWTFLVCLGLGIRVMMGVVTRNPSYSIRAQTNAQRLHQLKLGVLVNVEDEQQQMLNQEEYNLIYRDQRSEYEKKRQDADSAEHGMSDKFEVWSDLRQRVKATFKGTAAW